MVRQIVKHKALTNLVPRQDRQLLDLEREGRMRGRQPITLLCGNVRQGSRRCDIRSIANDVQTCGYTVRRTDRRTEGRHRRHDAHI